MSTNPFDALGLPTRPDLTDGGPRRLAGHRDRHPPGPGRRRGVARYAAASDTSPLPVAVVPDGAEVPCEPTVGSGELIAAYTWQLPARIRYGRPVRLLIRGAVAALLCLGVLAMIRASPPRRSWR